MAEFSTPTSEQEYDANFSPIHPQMNSTEAFYESSRCLFCYDAPCVEACPTGIDIPLFIRQINTGDTLGAAQTIYDANYFGNACGKVCPTEVLCEGACVYNLQDVKPIEIGRLQSYASTTAIESDATLFLTAEDNGKSVAIVGAGPAGISCACELRSLGYSVTIFEGRAKPSGLTVHGVAPYKITDGEALEEVDYLQGQFGFEIRYGAWIDSDRLKNLFSEYDAVFIGIGLGRTREAGIPGSDMSGCYGAVEFIEELRAKRDTMSIGKNVVVIGGGNTAMDAASEAARLGAEKVTLAYRRDKQSMGAYSFEYDLAKHVGVDGLFNVQPQEVHGNGIAESISLARTEVRDGQVVTLPAVVTLPCDTVIFATGQSKQVDLLSTLSKLRLSGGRIEVGEDMQTAQPGYFAGGDAVNGGKEVVNAVADGKVAGQGIHQYLSS